MRFDAISHRSAYSDCYPINNDEIRIKIRTGKDVTKVNIIHDDPYIDVITGEKTWRGKCETLEMKYELKYHNIWTIVLNPKYKRELYYFQIFAGDEVYYLYEDDFYIEEQINKPGKMLQYFKVPWLNLSDVIMVPKWAEKTIWYQIMPDKFCRGDNAPKKIATKEWGDEEVITYNDFFGGDLQGIISKLDYLKDLGITGIYLTPIFESGSTHKYDTCNYEKIDSDFGTEKDLKQLVIKAHEHGIKIMIDAVFNHSGVKFDKWVDVINNGEKSEYLDWYFVNETPVVTDDYHKELRYHSFSFYGGMPKLNTNNEEVADYFVNLCKRWVNEWDIDGIRFDVGNEIAHTFIKRLRLELKKIKPDIYLLGEIWHDSIQWLQGDEYDSVMNYPFVESINDFWSDKESGSKDLMFSLNRMFNMYSEQVNKVMFNFLDSHDISRALTRCGNMDNFMQQLALLCTMPGSISIYYGTEVGMEGVKDPQTRRCMPWKDIENGKYDSIFNEVKSLLCIRNSHKECISDEIKWINDEKNPRLVHYFKISDSKKKLEVYMNISDKNVNVSIENPTIFKRKFKDGILKPGGIIICERSVKDYGENEHK